MCLNVLICHHLGLYFTSTHFQNKAKLLSGIKLLVAALTIDVKTIGELSYAGHNQQFEIKTAIFNTRI